jgi:prevent-host-death family protein
MRIASLAEVKARLSEFVKLCEEEKELVIITKHGKPSAMLVAIEDEEALERQLLARSPRFRRMVAEAMEEYRAEQTIPADQFWAKVLGEDDGS